ncbi:MAG: TolC family protein [Verrucomicrobia bacterium]|nr:TolC family protein [Verrucomicrobiota bacterium]
MSNSCPDEGEMIQVKSQASKLTRFAMPLSLSVLLICSGCYTSKSIIDPYSYAPRSPDNTWNPPSYVKAMPLNDAPPDLPTQDEPFSLAEIVDIALRNNVQTKITWAQARAAAAQWGQSQSQFFPQFTGEYSFLRARQPTFVTSVTSGAGAAAGGAPLTVTDVYYSVYGPQLQISYLVFDFGTLRATTESYRQALYNADWTHNNAIQVLIQTIMNDFYNYMYQKQLYVADQANVETAQTTLEVAEAGLRAGVKDITDFLQSQTQLLQNQTTLCAQQQNVQAAYAQLLASMGLPANMELDTLGLPTDLPNTDLLPPLEEMITLGLQNRPDLLAAEANLHSYEQQLKAAQRQFLPQVNYNFELGKSYFNGGLHDRYNFQSTIAVSMPIFSGYYYRNAIKIAKANKKTAEEQMKNSQIDIIQQITTYYSSVKVAYDTLKFAIAFLAASEEQYTVALAKYKEGTNTILDVVSAQSSLADARATEANAIQQWFTSLANLAYSTGMVSPTYLPTSVTLEETR